MFSCFRLLTTFTSSRITPKCPHSLHNPPPETLSFYQFHYPFHFLSFLISQMKSCASCENHSCYNLFFKLVQNSPPNFADKVLRALGVRALVEVLLDLGEVQQVSFHSLWGYAGLRQHILHLRAPQNPRHHQQHHSRVLDHFGELWVVVSC